MNPKLYEEAQRLIRVSEEFRISVETIEKEPETLKGSDSANGTGQKETSASEDPEETTTGKLTHSKLAQKLGLKTSELNEKMLANGYYEIRNGKNYLTNKGKVAGGEFRMGGKFGAYFLWPENFQP